MPFQMFSSEFNTWPKERGPKAPPAAEIVPSAMQDRGPTVVSLATPADEANAARSRMVPPPEKEDKMIKIYPRSQPNDQAVAVPIYSYAQLDRCSVAGLKMIASKLRDAVELAGGTVPPLMVSSQADVVIRWVLDVQVGLGQELGLDVDLSPESFGVPPPDSE